MLSGYVRVKFLHHYRSCFTFDKDMLLKDQLSKPISGKNKRKGPFPLTPFSNHKGFSFELGE